MFIYHVDYHADNKPYSSMHAALMKLYALYLYTPQLYIKVIY